MALIRFTIPRYHVPSQNVRDHWHWGRRNNDSKICQFLIRNGLAAAGISPPPATGPRHCRILAYRPRLVTDDANLRGGAKGLVDAIVRAGLLVDDKDSLARITYAQCLAGKQGPRVDVEIEDVVP